MPYIYSQHLLSDLDAMSQTMLLTKRLATFLSQNTSPQLPTLLLMSPNGKLLSSSSPLPASTLRTQATLACTLWKLYHPLQPSSSDIISTSLQPSNVSSDPPSQAVKQDSATPENDLSSITIQLSDGIMVIRVLSCSLLFVALGPSSTSQPSPSPSSQTLPTQAQHVSSSSLSLPPGSPSTEGHEGLGKGSHGGEDVASLRSGAPSDVGSIGSTRRAQAGIMTFRRQAADIGRWLDGSLESFVFSSGEVR